MKIGHRECVQSTDQLVFKLGEIAGAGEAATRRIENFTRAGASGLKRIAEKPQSEIAQPVWRHAGGMGLGDGFGDPGTIEKLAGAQCSAARPLDWRGDLADAHSVAPLRRVASFASIAFQMVAATSGPPVLAIARSPVGEVTLISVR